MNIIHNEHIQHFFHQFNTLFIHIRDGKDLADYGVQASSLHVLFPQMLILAQKLKPKPKPKPTHNYKIK